METKRQNRSIARLYVLPILVCILLATTVWVAVMRIGYTERFDDIPVTITGLNETQFELKAKDKVSGVRFRGNRNSFSDVNENEIKAYADVSALKEAGSYEVMLTFSCPSDITLEEPIYFTVELVKK